MYIRFKPGEYYNEMAEVPRAFNSLAPVMVPRELFTQLLPNMAPNEWCLYSVLLYYETLKYEQKMPYVQEIKERHFPNWTQELFDSALDQLELIMLREDGQKKHLVDLTATEQ